MAIILPYKGVFPEIQGGVFLAPSSSVVGDVRIGQGSSVWFSAVLRGDVNFIRIGENVNIQDGTVCHVTGEKHPLVIGDNVTVGHNATLHGCTLESCSFVGMGATVMDGAVLESGSMLAAGSLLTPGKCVKQGELWSGLPAKFMRMLTEEEVAFLLQSAKNYYNLSREYLAEEQG